MRPRSHWHDPMVLLERGPALGSVAEYLASAATGHGRLVLIGGDAGVGKTTFVADS